MEGMISMLAMIALRWMMKEHGVSLAQQLSTGMTMSAGRLKVNVGQENDD